MIRNFRNKLQYIIILLAGAYGMVAAQPDSSLLFKANAGLQQGKYSQAFNGYKKALQERLPDQYYLRAGIASYYTGNYKAALQQLANCGLMLKAERTLWQAKAHAQLQNYGQAVKQLKAHTSARLRQTSNNLMMDSAFLELSRTEPWNRFWANSPYGEYDATYADARTQYQDSNYQFALELLDDLLQHRNHIRARWLRARVLSQLGSYKAALDDINAIAAFFPTHPQMLVDKTEILLKMGNKRKALQTISKGLDYDPYYLPLHKLKGQALAQKRDTEGGVASLERYLRYNEEDVKARFTLGKLYLKNKSYLKALSEFNRVLAKDQAKVAYFKTRGKTYLETETYKQAESDFSMALDLKPSGTLYYLRGNARYYSGNLKGACSDWEKALRYGYNDAIINKERFCK